MLPVGGSNVTNDVAIGLKTSIAVAEELKIKHGTCDLRSIGEDEEISVSVLGEDAGRTVGRLEVSQIIEARMREMFELLRDEIRAAGVGMLPAGVDADRRRGAAVGRRRARPRGAPDAGPRRRAGGHRRAHRSRSSTRLQHRRRAAPVGRREPRLGDEPRYESAPAGGGLGRLRDAIRNIFP